MEYGGVLRASILVAAVATTGASAQRGSAQGIWGAQQIDRCALSSKNMVRSLISPDDLVPRTGDTREKLQENIGRLTDQYQTLLEELGRVLKKYRIVQTGFGTEGKLRLHLYALDIDIEQYRVEIRCLDREMERTADTRNANLMELDRQTGNAMLPSLGRYHPHAPLGGYLPRGLDMELFLIPDHSCGMSTTKEFCNKRSECSWRSPLCWEKQRAKRSKSQR